MIKREEIVYQKTGNSSQKKTVSNKIFLNF